MRLTFLKTQNDGAGGRAFALAEGGRRPRGFKRLLLFTSDELPPVDLVGWSQLRGKIFTQAIAAGSQSILLSNGGFVFEAVARAVDLSALPFAADALDGSATEAPLPDLPRGRSFVGRLRFISVAARDDVNYLGAVGLSGNFAEIRFPIRTTLGTLAPAAAIHRSLRRPFG